MNSMMEYTTATITTHQEWNECLSHFPEANFLQSWEWGVFEEQLGKKVVREAVFTGDVCVACAQGVVEKARRGDYMTVAGGPLVAEWHNEELMGMIFSGIKRHALEADAVFIRVRPQQIMTPEHVAKLELLGYRPAPMHLSADRTLQLNLALSEEELLAQMRKNTRASIRKAANMGITVVASQALDDIAEFYHIQRQVAERHNFIPFSEVFLTEQFKVFAQSGQATLFKSYHEGQLLAEAFVIFFNGEAVYHYGVSTDQNHDKPGSYACQWQAILEAKRRGCHTYNFWGVAPPDKPHHRFAGVSLFKRGFGGEEVEYIPAHDLPLTSRYWLVWIIEIFRKKLRRL